MQRGEGIAGGPSSDVCLRGEEEFRQPYPHEHVSPQRDVPPCASSASEFSSPPFYPLTHRSSAKEQHPSVNHPSGESRSLEAIPHSRPTTHPHTSQAARGPARRSEGCSLPPPYHSYLPLDSADLEGGSWHGLRSGVASSFECKQVRVRTSDRRLPGPAVHPAGAKLPLPSPFCCRLSARSP